MTCSLASLFVAAAIALVFPLAFPLMPSALLTRLTFHIRSALYVSAFGANSILAFALALVLSLVGRRGLICHWVARTFYATCSPLVGLSFIVENEEILRQNHPAIILGNHQTILDILYLGAVMPPNSTIMAKKSIQYIPFLGTFMTLARAVFVNRARREDAIRVLGDAVANLRRDSLSLFIFPEGTRSYATTPTLLPFKKGPFHMAIAAQLPIVPLVVENYSKYYSPKTKTFSGKKGLVIKVLDPIPTEGLAAENVDALVEKTRGVMVDAVKELDERRKAVDALEGVFAE